MKTLDFRIRKLHVNTDADKRLQKRQPSRIYVNEEALIELTGSKDGGRAICIERIHEENPVRREATLWKAPEKLDKTVTQMYDVFRDACGFKLGESVRITALGGGLPDAEEVVLEQMPGVDGSLPEPMAPEDTPGWEVLLAGRLSQIEHVYAGWMIKNMFVRGPERSFIVTSVNGRPTGNARYIDRKTRLVVGTAAPKNDDGEGQINKVSDRKLEITGIKGLDAPLKKLNDLLRVFASGVILKSNFSFPGIVIHGGHGTGKTMLLNSLAKTGWGTVFRIKFKDKLTEIHETFQKAKLQQPSIILIDQLERLIDKERSNRDAVILALCELLDGLAADAVTKGEAPQVLVVATCLDYTSDIPEDLKDPGRFTSEIYIPMPDVEGRREILSSLGLCVQPDQEEELLSHLSASTHAYNGKDLRRLADEACLIGTTRHLSSLSLSASNPNPSPLLSPPPEAEEDEPSPSPAATLIPADYHSALRLVRPSLMHDINLKPPPIHWDDIAGQALVKQSLRRAVRLSLEPPEVLAQFFDRPPKGFLLYGPPGCSKTMAAQAMTTESGLNFFAVKGAELLNMYVGESERAVRRLFQRAREVAPSMIFFDEIDSIAGQRSGFSSSSSKSNGSSGGVNVLTTLLNEMDGFEALHGVVVLAATNRPHALDPALLRPGRFDELIYVSPPDEEARRAIFTKVGAKRKMNDDVDIDKLVRNTEGYSGAEIKGICAAAGVAAYDRFITEGIDGGIQMGDLEQAIKNQKKQITREMIKGFEDWERQFGKV
ncbi:P-loop containing nucleoside triphosphate hydrolase protein [Apiosordaria backusii]|uniref:P-loop containing nucleoside triphosphate hydrolase protein n=1 Tax=Apiosordaria backusii TaxID=314023 RepID=A0AA40BK95_9PEZI|nr:P-loop containing nucleoside triphosphate hydrolase protein [Apiosordaria backusii]